MEEDTMARPVTLEAGYREFADRWNPIMDVFDREGVRFGLEVHPTEIAYDIVTTEKALAAIGHRAAFGLNFDPSHLYHQFVDSALFIETFADRIYHVHINNSVHTLNGRTSSLGSHLDFGDARRGWDFRTPGRGGVDFEEIIRALNRIGYDGPLSVEWEDSGMDRNQGAPEAAAFVHRLDFQPSGADESGATQRVGVDDAFVAAVQFANGAIGTLEASRFARGRRNHQVIEINGAKGSIVFNVERLNELEVYLPEEETRQDAQGFRTVLVTEPTHPYVGAWWPQGHIIGWEHSFVHEIKHFFDCVTTGRPVGPEGADFEDGYRASVVADAIVQSANSGRRVDIDY